jgi:hypothetical protein
MTSLRRLLVRVGSLVLVGGGASSCGTLDNSSPPPFSAADVVGEYTLSSIAWNASVPEEPVPTWTWPGRVWVLGGHLSLRANGTAITSGSSRITILGETTNVSGTDTVRWTVRPDGILDFVSGRQFPENQGRAAQHTVAVYSGGLTSGGTIFRYQRP